MCCDIIKNFVGFSMKWGRNSKHSLLYTALLCTFISLLTIWTLRQTEVTGIMVIQFSLHALPLSCILVHLNFLEWHIKCLFMYLFFMHSIVGQTYLSVDYFSNLKPVLHIFELWFGPILDEIWNISWYQASSWKFWKAAPVILSLIYPWQTSLSKSWPL